MELRLDVVVGDVAAELADDELVGVVRVDVVEADRLAELEVLELVDDLVDRLLGVVQLDPGLLEQDAELVLGRDAVLVDGVHHLVGRERVHWFSFCCWFLVIGRPP